MLDGLVDASKESWPTEAVVAAVVVYAPSLPFVCLLNSSTLEMEHSRQSASFTKALGVLEPCIQAHLCLSSR